ncbi:MAG TPA: hypothetical protein VGR78_04720 [Verrucomicrobiae bacterium]|jgi:hypothetical protein|nr:hypothetical protein [Verrucomicrobiae bacterium]
MPETVTAAAEDTLCTIAARFGFLNCDALRADPANAPFLNRPLQAGDIVTIPDIVLNVLDKANEKLHEFVRKGIPAPSIRFVHGSPDKPYKDDASLTFLNVSNYVSDKAGNDGRSALPTGFNFNAFGHADPDTFKVEVVEPNGGADLEIELEALKPVLAADGSITGHESFADAQANLRKMKVKCQKVTSPTYKGYRSRYLRLVVDEEDLKAISGDPLRTDGTAQGLFTSDMADGNNGDADKIEILDQLVRATYVLKDCKAADPNKCKVQASVPLAPDKQKIKLCFHVFRTTAGVAGGRVGGITDKGLHRRTAKWYRRTYAQAGFGPVLVAPAIEELDPPPPDMLCIGQPNGGNATGLTAGGAGSSLTFDLELHPIGAGPIPPAVNVNINLQAAVAANGGPMTTAQVAAAVVAALPAGFAGQVFAVQPAYSSVSPPSDIIISHSSGQRVFIRNEACTDAGVGVTVARINFSSLDDSTLLPPFSPSIRRVCHAGTVSDNQMDCFVIDQWNNNGLRGLALIPDNDIPDIVLPDGTHISRAAQAPVRFANIMAMKCAASTGGTIATLDETDTLPYTYPHESGHVMMDAIHAIEANPRTELMRAGTAEQNTLLGSKRICDDPVQIKYQLRGAVTVPGGAVTETRLSAVQRLLARGAQVFQPW